MPLLQSPAAASEQPVAGAEAPGVNGAEATVGTDGSTGEGEQVGEKGEVSVHYGETGVCVQEGETGGVCEEVSDTGGACVQRDTAGELSVQEGETGGA